MLCPKCKKEIETNSLKCSFCNTRVASVCKHCGSYNPITATECSNCGEVLIKICTECKAANLPQAKKCRKCGIEFVKKEEIQKISSVQYAPNVTSQQKAKEKLIEGIKSGDSRIITLCGESGVGKNLILRHAINELKSAKLIWLWGGCTQITQLSPLGYFQDLLLTFFNINNFCPDTLQLKKNSVKFFKHDFPSLTNNEIFDLLNLLYPNNVDKYENIYFNKAKIFGILKKVFQTIVEKTKVVFIVDNFDCIDGMSYDFFKEIFEDDYMLERSKFILINREVRPGMGLFNITKLDANNYLDLTISSFTPAQTEALLKQYTNFDFGKDFANFAVKIAQGNPSIVEQMVLLQRDIRKNNLKNICYDSPESLIKLRLNLLCQEDYQAFRLLSAMSVLGSKFYPAMLEQFDNNSSEEFERIIQKLTDLGFITQLNNLAFKFKTYEIWQIIVNCVKNTESFGDILSTLLEQLSCYKQSSLALLAYICQKLNREDDAFEYWTLLMKHACSIGDVGLYIIVQKQALKLIENKNTEFFIRVKKNIYSRVGKLLEPIDHNSSFEFLQQAIMLLDDDEDELHVELLGYLASCCMKMGNFWGVIECTDSVLNKLSVEKEVDTILVKSRQIRPLLRIGNYGQLINICETELLPVFEKYLNKGRNLPNISINELFKIWLNIYFDYAEALVMQGDNKAFDIIKNIYDILEKNNINDNVFLCKANLLLAFANTVKGSFSVSNTILDDILKDFVLDNMDSFIIARWNFIDILNKFFIKDTVSLRDELFNVTAYANNINDSFTKNILKTLLAKMLKDSNQSKKALEILEEQVSYFANEKISTGVLLSWYLISKIKLITFGTQFALDIATKALDIAQTPNINNHYFITLFNKLIGEIYLAKQDFESAKIYFEKAIFLAKHFDLQYALVKIYLQYAKLYQELALPATNERGSYVKNAIKLFQLAKNVPIVAEEVSIQKRIKEDMNVLTSFCRLNGISLRKESK